MQKEKKAHKHVTCQLFLVRLRQFYNVRFLLTQIFTCSTDEVTMAQLVRENTFNDSRPI